MIATRTGLGAAFRDTGRMGLNVGRRSGPVKHRPGRL